MASTFKVTTGISVLLWFAMHGELANMEEAKNISCFDCYLEGKYYRAAKTHHLPMEPNKCRRYLCFNGAFSLEEDGCEIDGKCYKVGKALNRISECAVLMCRRNRSSEIRETEFVRRPYACVDGNGTCQSIGSTFTKECKTYKCEMHSDGNAHAKLEYIDGCELDGKCYKKGYSTKDQCERHTCMVTSANGSPVSRIVSTPSACRITEEVCIKDGRNYDHDCKNYKCTFRLLGGKGTHQLKIVPTGCKVDDKCHKIGVTYKKNCLTYKCIKAKVNGTYVARFEVVAGGCKFYRKCIGPRILFKYHCADFICLPSADKNGARIYEMIVWKYLCQHGSEDTCLKKGENFTYQGYKNCNCVVYRVPSTGRYAVRNVCGGKQIDTSYLI
ncbi:collagen alpha-5(vi) chain [Plakobranchus ocellatus]|uniref:Collagen alpha-5(Vi) chain n=1 Tax=Plakobranchus ocellatus TaxID=259542 RepID=A0AAV3Y8G9_9GAST|nr:collagen alpha-5(vi) chain [Plakobranchus ocellatus]